MKNPVLSKLNVGPFFCISVCRALTFIVRQGEKKDEEVRTIAFAHYISKVRRRRYNNLKNSDFLTENSPLQANSKFLENYFFLYLLMFLV